MPISQNQGPSAATLLRSRAEEQLRHEPKEPGGMSAEQMQAALHELRVHQIELEMQNEQLRATQTELEQVRDRYVQLFDFAPVGYLTLNDKGLIVAANLTSARLLGIERARLLSLPFSHFVLSADQETYYLCWRKVINFPGTQACEVRLRPAEGKVFHARLEAIQADEAGAPVCRLTVSDITEHKRAEEALRESERRQLLESRAKQLETLVGERTARLQEAVGELEHFSYTLAHDLRAPLRVIKGYSDLLLAQCTELSPEHRRFLVRSGFAVLRMDQLIVDALDYNKLVSQSFPLAPIDCAALLQELIESYPQFQEARASISIAGTIPPVLGNTALLTQCFSNLLNNALKFVPPGRVPAVRVSAQDLGQRVRICVEDNGIGIPEQVQGKIFQMFQRLNHDYEGTGIGLALVKKAVERMRGAVGVESQPGQGSRFWLELNKPEPQP